MKEKTLTLMELINMEPIFNSVEEARECKARVNKLELEVKFWQLRFTICAGACTTINKTDGTIEHIPEYCNQCLCHLELEDVTKKIEGLK